MTRGVKYIVQGTGATAPVSYWRESVLLMANERAFRSCVHSPSLARDLITFWATFYRDLWDSFWYNEYSTKQGKHYEKR